MTKRITLAIFVTLLLVGVGCKKTKLTGTYAAYEGTWKSQKITLVLKSNGKADYKNLETGDYIENGRLIITDSKLTIKLIAKVEFNISIQPTQDSNSSLWLMALDDDYYAKY